MERIGQLGQSFVKLLGRVIHDLSLRSYMRVSDYYEETFLLYLSLGL